jgi:hypothetical protein
MTTFPRRSAELPPARSISEERVDRIGEGLRIIRRHDHSRAFHHFTPRYICHDHRSPTRHRLEKGERHALPPRRRDNQVGSPKFGGRVDDLAAPFDPVVYAQ